MSHFTVIVTGDNVEEQLNPFQEVESTGEMQYAQDVDTTEEALATYERSTVERLKHTRSGELHTMYNPLGNYKSQFMCVGDHGEAKLFVPADFTLVNVPAKEVESFEQWASHWYGYEILSVDNPLDREGEHKFGYIKITNPDTPSKEVKVIRRTNPNSQWDWWVVGGRWSGLFKLKPGAEGGVGEPGVMNTRFAEGADRADVARKGDIDFEAMRMQARSKAYAEWEDAHCIIAGRTWKTWEILRKEFEEQGFTIDDASKAYHAQPVVADHRKTEVWRSIDDFVISREDYCQAAMDRVGVPFAILHNGEWHERGEMGWWATVSNEKSSEEWSAFVTKFYNELPDDTLLTVVDCHI